MQKPFNFVPRELQRIIGQYLGYFSQPYRSPIYTDSGKELKTDFIHFNLSDNFITVLSRLDKANLINQGKIADDFFLEEKGPTIIVAFGQIDYKKKPSNFNGNLQNLIQKSSFKDSLFNAITVSNEFLNKNPPRRVHVAPNQCYYLLDCGSKLCINVPWVNMASYFPHDIEIGDNLVDFSPNGRFITIQQADYTTYLLSFKEDFKTMLSLGHLSFENLGSKIYRVLPTDKAYFIFYDSRVIYHSIELRAGNTIIDLNVDGHNYQTLPSEIPPAIVMVREIPGQVRIWKFESTSFSQILLPMDVTYATCVNNHPWILFDSVIYQVKIDEDMTGELSYELQYRAEVNPEVKFFQVSNDGQTIIYIDQKGPKILYSAPQVISHL